VCANGAEGVGQWKAPTAQARTCSGSAGSSSCGLGSNVGCNGFVCASSTACKTTCSMDADCVDGFYCAGGSCQARKSNGSYCTADNNCQSRVCISSTCVECEGWILGGSFPNASDDCPHDRPLCVNNACVPCPSDPTWFEESSCYLDPFDPQGTVKDGSVLIGEGCGTRGFPAVNSRGDWVCSGCGSTTDCPPGQVCVGAGGYGSCRNRGGQPCVSNDCVYGSCPQGGGTCALAGQGSPCDLSQARPASGGCQNACVSASLIEVSASSASTNVSGCQ
jgi:hypothetical protein